MGDYVMVRELTGVMHEKPILPIRVKVIDLLKFLTDLRGLDTRYVPSLTYDYGLGPPPELLTQSKERSVVREFYWDLTTFYEAKVSSYHTLLSLIHMMYTYSFLKSIVKAKSVAILTLITMTIHENSRSRTIRQRNKSVPHI